MSVPLLIGAAVDLLILLVLTVLVRNGFRNSLSSIEEKSAGFWFYYRSGVHQFLRGETRFLPTFLHYVALHLVVPLWGLALFWRTDINFLAIIAGLLWSLQLLQRLYPGPGLAAVEPDSLDRES